MKTNKESLNFKKQAIIELNETQLFEIEGGSTAACVGLFVASVALSYQITTDVFGGADNGPGDGIFGGGFEATN